jgi:hypothetical protein
MSRKKIKVTTDNDLGRFLTVDTEVKKQKVEVKPRVKSDVKYSKDWLEDLNYQLEILPSGKTNICHREKFEVNGFSSTRSKGFWIKTFDCSIKELPDKIKSLEFI